MIKISTRLFPFSHQPKSRCLIPGTEFLVEACPALVRIKNFEGKVLKEIVLDIEGPLKHFTVMQDLERGCVTLFSERYRFHILPSCEVRHTKNPHLPPIPIQERLCLGTHKKQEWEGIKKRMDFREIFPLWYRLGSLLHLPERKEEDLGIFSLLRACAEAIDTHRPEQILPQFHKLFLAGFRDFMVPRTQDDDFQGILPLDIPQSKSSPLYLLNEGAKLIRALFLVSSENEFAILPNLPPEFFSGRMLHLACPPYGEINLEWSKKMIRKVEFQAKMDGIVYFHFPSSLRTYRLRLSTKEKGHITSCREPLEIQSGCFYLLDRFQK